MERHSQEISMNCASDASGHHSEFFFQGDIGQRRSMFKSQKRKTADVHVLLGVTAAYRFNISIFCFFSNFQEMKRTLLW